MKKLSAILLAVALVVMACVPFCASAEDAVGGVTFKVNATDIQDGQFTLNVDYAMTGLHVLGGEVEIGYDASKVEIAAAEGTEAFKDNGSYNSKSKAITYKGAGSSVITNKTSFDTGVKVLVASSDPFEDAEGTLVTIAMKVKDGVEADSLEFTVNVNAWNVGDADKPGEMTNVIPKDAPQSEKLTVKLAADPTTTEAPAPTTEAPAPTTEAPAPTATTKAPNKTGEATPWALMATVAVAGAALVVLTTKKSK